MFFAKLQKVAEKTLHMIWIRTFALIESKQKNFFSHICFWQVEISTLESFINNLKSKQKAFI
jgi:hypothetical protein